MFSLKMTSIIIKIEPQPNPTPTRQSDWEEVISIIIFRKIFSL